MKSYFVVVLAWFLALPAQATEPVVVVTGPGKPVLNISSVHLLKSTGDMVPWVTVITKPYSKSDAETLVFRGLVISAALKEGYQETMLQFLGQDEKPNVRIDQQISCSVAIHGDMIGVRTEVRCGLTSGYSYDQGMFVVYANASISSDEFGVVVPLIITKIDEVYSAARRALINK